MRVLVADPYYVLEDIAENVGDLAEVELADAPWEGEDVVALLVSPDQPVGVTELDRLPALRIVATCSAAAACLLYTSPSPRDLSTSRMPSSA